MVPPHRDAPPAPHTTLQNIPANPCRLAVPGSILDFRSFHGKTLGQVALLLLYQDVPRLCGVSLASPGLWKQQSLVPRHPLAAIPAGATQPGCCLFKTFIPKSE